MKKSRTNWRSFEDASVFLNRQRVFMLGYEGKPYKGHDIYERDAWNDGAYAAKNNLDQGFFERQQESKYGRWWV